MLTLEDRRRLTTTPLAERRRVLKGQICEFCHAKPARNVLKASLSLCCVVRADRCPGSDPTGSLCYGCGAPATTKTKSGWVCGSDSWTGCRGVTEAQHLAKSTTQALQLKDPEFRERRRLKYGDTMEARYGGRGTLAIPEKRAKFEATSLERFGVLNPASSEVIKERVRATNQRIYGVDYPSQLEDRRENFTKSCTKVFGVPSCVSSPEWREAYMGQTGEDHPTRLPSTKMAMSLARSSLETQQRYQVTCRLRYGADHPCQDPHTFLTRYLPRCYRRKEFTLPSGKVVYYQGYELPTLEANLLLHGEVNLLFNGELHFSYTDPHTGKSRVYYPDLAIPSTRRCIEVKSLYTLRQGLKSDLVSKLSAAQAEGWEPIVELRGPDLRLIQTYSLNELKALSEAV